MSMAPCGSGSAKVRCCECGAVFWKYFNFDQPWRSSSNVCPFCNKSGNHVNADNEPLTRIPGPITKLARIIKGLFD